MLTYLNENKYRIAFSENFCATNKCKKLPVLFKYESFKFRLLKCIQVFKRAGCYYL